MTGKTVTDWQPEEDLTALLDTLTEELFAIRDDEVAGCMGEMAGGCHEIVQEMRRLVAAADADPMLPPVSDFAAAALRADSSRQ